MEICHHYDYLSLKDIGLSKAIRRYCIYNHFKLYTIGMIIYRKIVQKDATDSKCFDQCIYSFIYLGLRNRIA